MRGFLYFNLQIISKAASFFYFETASFCVGKLKFLTVETRVPKCGNDNERIATDLWYKGNGQ